MLFVTPPEYYELHRFPEEYEEIATTVSEHRLERVTPERVKVHVGEGSEAAWVVAYEGDWVGVCMEFGCAHIFTDEQVKDGLRRVHQ